MVDVILAALSFAKRAWAIKPVRWAAYGLGAIAAFLAMLALTHIKFEALRAEGAKTCEAARAEEKRQAGLESRYVGDKADQARDKAETTIVYRDRWLAKEAADGKAAIDDADGEEARWNAWRDALIRLRDGQTADRAADEDRRAERGADGLRDRDSAGMGGR